MIMSSSWHELAGHKKINLGTPVRTRAAPWYGVVKEQAGLRAQPFLFSLSPGQESFKAPSIRKATRWALRKTESC